MHLFSLREVESNVIETNIPGRLDRLPWSKWHWLIVIGLGITWVLDGLEVTLAGAIGGVLRRPDTLGLSDTQVGASATFYLIGAVSGALLFGYLTDLLGRKKLFMVTLLLYLVSTAMTAFSWNFLSYAMFRTLTGAGIGGEYSAINSAIDELIPARVRGTVDLIINSTFWIGAALGSVGTIVLLDKGWVSVNLGWRLAFGIGAVLGCIILVLRHWVPESPRWLIIHGHQHEAERTVAGIEEHVVDHPDKLPRPEYSLRIRTRSHTTFSEIWDSIFHKHRTRSLLGLTLMVAQAFFYNAISSPMRSCWLSCMEFQIKALASICCLLHSGISSDRLRLAGCSIPLAASR
jgi:MFS family permease